MTKDANLNTPAVLASIAKALREAENLRLKIAVEELCESAASGEIDGDCDCRTVRYGHYDFLECEIANLKSKGPLKAISNAYLADTQRTVWNLHPWQVSPHLFDSDAVTERAREAMDALVEQIRRFLRE